jgi:CheY-like chemotaxis protein
MAKKVLIIDDDMTLLEMYVERLKMEGYEVLSATNGEDGIKEALREKPDVILLDIMMPRINGFGVMEKIKENPATKDIPVIFLTALIQDSTREKGKQAGAKDFIVKSETMPGEVIEKIKKVMA